MDAAWARVQSKVKSAFRKAKLVIPEIVEHHIDGATFFGLTDTVSRALEKLAGAEKCVKGFGTRCYLPKSGKHISVVT